MNEFLRPEEYQEIYDRLDPPHLKRVLKTFYEGKSDIEIALIVGKKDFTVRKYLNEIAYEFGLVDPSITHNNYRPLLMKVCCEYLKDNF